jgi:hypothetical protein
MLPFNDVQRTETSHRTNCAPTQKSEKEVHDSVGEEEKHGIEDVPECFEGIRYDPGEDVVYDRHDRLTV